jgi:hypothetical protein
LQFWYYVSDVSQFDVANQLEFCSGGGPDNQEYSWDLNKCNLKNGWNLLQLPISSAGITNGPVNPLAMNFIRLYRFKKGNVVTKIDDIRIVGHGIEDVPEDTTGTKPNVLPDNNAISYTGRIDYSDPKNYRFSYSGITISTLFEGTSISVILKSNHADKSFYYVFIDDKMPFKIAPNASGDPIEIIRGLEDKLHSIKLIRLTETLHSIDAFKGFIVEKNKKVQKPAEQNQLKFEFIGNSITCGFGNEALNASPDPGNNPSIQNYWESYAAILTRAFRAKQVAISVSGIGMYRNNGGPVAGTPDNNLPATYDRVIYHEVTPKWDFKNYTPDVVFVGLGTNDLGGSGAGYNLSLFESAYRVFLDTLRSKYNNAHIVLTTGSMLGGNGLKDLKTTIDKMVTERRAAGDVKISSLIMSTQQGDLGKGSSGHPTIAQNYKNSNELIGLLEEITDTISSPIISKVGFGQLQNEIQITVSKPMKANSSLKGFKVTLAGSEVAQTESYISTDDNTKIILRLSRNPKSTEEIRLFYNAGNAIDENGHELISFSMYNANFQNKLTTIGMLTVNEEGTELSVAFNKPIAPVTSIEGIKITDDSSNEIAVALFVVNPDKKGMVLKFSEVQKKGKALYFSYSGTSIQGEDNITLTAVSNRVIVNNSTVTAVNTNRLLKAKVFPNPAKDYITIDLGSNIDSLHKIKIINSAGEIIYALNTRQELNTISRNKLGYSGIYTVQILDEDNRQVGAEKFVLE